MNSHSMEPLLTEGSRVTVYPVELSELQRGDVVLYAVPNHDDELQIKRIVGLPGETIEIKEGMIYVDGSMIVESYPVAPIPADQHYSPITLASDEYFLLGDNRPASADSRVHGPVPTEMIRGKAISRQ